HFEFASRNDASKAISTAKADPRNSTPSDFVPQQQSMNEGIKNTSYDYLFAGASSIAIKVEEEEASSTIKLEDLANLVSNVKPRFKDLDSPKDDPVIVVDDSDEDEEDELHTTTNAETKSQRHKLELEKNKAEAKAALLKAQPSCPDMG
ncbi:hypothetical protein Tco_0119595, partial [Tanacetum coccineum]